jgi:MraZ protein
VDADGPQSVSPVEPPRGMYPGRLDEKGRLKLPVAFQQFFTSLPERKLFVTSLDRRTAQIYPMQVWRENEKFFETYHDHPRMARSIAFNANDLGADVEMDSQGRVLFPPELRRELGIEDSAVRLFAYKGRIEVLSDAIYQERRRQATEVAEEGLELLERAGLK